MRFIHAAVAALLLGGATLIGGCYGTTAAYSTGYSSTWVDGGYVWVGNQWVWYDGYWSQPGYAYISGTWYPTYYDSYYRPYGSYGYNRPYGHYGYYGHGSYGHGYYGNHHHGNVSGYFGGGRDHRSMPAPTYHHAAPSMRSAPMSHPAPAPRATPVHAGGHVHR